jgi:hypothetical protein
MGEVHGIDDVLDPAPVFVLCAIRAILGEMPDGAVDGLLVVDVPDQQSQCPTTASEGIDLLVATSESRLSGEMPHAGSNCARDAISLYSTKVLGDCGGGILWPLTSQ